jgi:hypothetical protein
VNAPADVVNEQPIAEADVHLHPASEDPFWNESAWFSFAVPERALSGFVHFYHRPNMRYSFGGVGLWDPSGQYQHDCLHYDWEMCPIEVVSDMFEFRMGNSLSATCLEPLRSYRFGYDRLGCVMDLSWSAFMPPHGSGFPAATSRFGGGHWEQGGRMRGAVTLDGESVEIDCWSNHDRSWGPRHLWDFRPGDMPWGIASERHAFNLLVSSVADPDSDVPVDRVVTGWQLRNGVKAHVVSGTRIVERDGDGRPTLVRLDALDELGRTLEAVGRPVNNLDWHPYPEFFQFWGLTRWELNGEEAWGEIQDSFPLADARRLVRTSRGL